MKIALHPALQSLAEPLCKLSHDIIPPDQSDADITFLPQDALDAAQNLRESGYDGELVFVGPAETLPSLAAQFMPSGHLTLPAMPDDLRKILQSCEAMRRHPDRVYFLNTREKRMYIPHEEIRYFTSSGHHAHIFTTGSKEAFTQLRKLDDIEAELTQLPYVRCHQRYLVNLVHVAFLDHAAMRLYLHDGEALPVSKRCFSATVEAMRALATP